MCQYWILGGGGSCNSLLALRMKVNTTDFSFSHVHADVVEALETSARYIALAMIRDQKMLLPSHEDVVLRPPWLVVRGEIEAHVSLRMGAQVSPRWEA